MLNIGDKLLSRVNAEEYSVHDTIGEGSDADYVLKHEGVENPTYKVVSVQKIESSYYFIAQPHPADKNKARRKGRKKREKHDFDIALEKGLGLINL